MNNFQPPRLFLPDTVQRPSGLWVAGAQQPPPGLPEIPDGQMLIVGRPPSDLDAIFVAPEAEALGIPPVSIETVEGIVGRLPFEPAMMALAVISGSVWFAGNDQAKHLRLAEDVFGTGRPIFERLRRFVAEGPNHLVFNEQHLTVLMRLLVAGQAPDEGMRELTDEEVDLLLMAMIGIATPIAEAGNQVADPGTPLDWVPFLVRSGLYFDKSNLGSDQGRARALFVDRFSDADPAGHRWCDLAEWMNTDLASMPEQVGFAYAVGAWSNALEEDASLVERKIAIKLDGLLAGQLPPQMVERLVAAISADRPELAARCREGGETLDHLIWDRAPFEQRPFLRLSDGRMILLSPRFLYAWMGEGFYYRLLDSASARKMPNSPSRSMSRRFTEFHGELMEDYVLHLSADCHREQTRAGLATVAGEVAYTAADGSESLSPDTTIAFGTELVAIEVTGGRPPRRARVLSDPAQMLEVIDRVIAKMKELDSALKEILDERVEIEGLDLSMLERVWPLVVVPSTILQSEMLWDHIDAAAPELFDDPRVQAPTLFSIEDYEHAAALVEGGHGLPALLGARLNSVFKTMPPSHFFHRQKLEAGRPRYVDRQMRLAGEEATDLLFRSDDQRPA
jgi:hypothetical protein